MELTGKKINFLGDSITEGCCASSPDNGYVEVLKRIAFLEEARNYGIGGTRIARQRVPSQEPKFDLDFCARANQMDKDADVIMVFGGTNDHGHGDAPMGSSEDRTPDTFIGACHYLWSELKHFFPKSVIVVLTPLHRTEEDIPKGKDGWILRDYASVIKSTAMAHGLHVLDLFESEVLQAHIPESAEKYTTDGLHPNNDGHRILAEEIYAFLRKL